MNWEDVKELLLYLYGAGVFTCVFYLTSKAVLHDYFRGNTAGDYLFIGCMILLWPVVFIVGTITRFFDR